jgi:outer membrane protein W
MKFTKIVAIVAILSVAAQASAADVGSSEQAVMTVQTVSKPQPVAQPVLVVEASPASDSRAESLRKARQGVEVQTEQKIVEKLEESRLKEEQARAQRLFGNKIENSEGAAPSSDATSSSTSATVPAGSSTVVTPASGVVVVTPAAAQPTQVAPPPAAQPTQVTIEKIEIVQPAAPAAPAPAPVAQPASPAVAPAVAAPVMEEPKSPVAENKIDSEDEADDAAPSKTFYVTGVVGAVNYRATNVRSNGAIGVGAGMLLPNNWALEGSYVYSSHQIDTFWQPNIYRDMDQHDLQAVTKYYFPFNNLKPYVGAGLTYSIRKYSDRMINSSAWWVNPYTTHEETQALSLGILGGADFQVSKNFLIGGGVEWNTNVFNNNSIVFSDYGLPPNTRAIEEIDFVTLKLNAKMTF